MKYLDNMTEKEFENKKFRIGQKVHFIHTDMDKSGKRRYFLRSGEISSIWVIITKMRKFVDSITVEFKNQHSRFYSYGCNHHQFIFTNKREAEKALREFKKKYENGL